MPSPPLSLQGIPLRIGLAARALWMSLTIRLSMGVTLFSSRTRAPSVSR